MLRIHVFVCDAAYCLVCLLTLAACRVFARNIHKQPVGFLEVLGRLLCSAEVQQATAYGIGQGGHVSLGAAIVLAHLVEGIHSDAEGSFVVAFLEHHVGQATGRLVVVQCVVLTLDICRHSLLVVEFRRAVMALVEICHTTPSVGIHLRQVAQCLQTVCKCEDTCIVAHVACCIHDAVGLAGADPGPFLFTTRK